jgi:hypothetical protein
MLVGDCWFFWTYCTVLLFREHDLTTIHRLIDMKTLFDTDQPSEWQKYDAIKLIGLRPLHWPGFLIVFAQYLLYFLDSRVVSVLVDVRILGVDFFPHTGLPLLERLFAIAEAATLWVLGACVRSMSENLSFRLNLCFNWVSFEHQFVTRGPLVDCLVAVKGRPTAITVGLPASRDRTRSPVVLSESVLNQLLDDLFLWRRRRLVVDQHWSRLPVLRLHRLHLHLYLSIWANQSVVAL